MPRCGRIRSFIREYNESARNDKMSFIPPFLILILEIILIVHSITHGEYFVTVLTSILLIISIIEIIFVSREIHEHYHTSNFERDLTIRLDDFILERKIENVKTTVEEFINNYPNYKKHRDKIYHITCQITETHKMDLWEKTLREKLEKFLLKSEKKSIKELIPEFIKKFPEYEKNPVKVNHIAAQLIIDNKINNKRKKSLNKLN